MASLQWDPWNFEAPMVNGPFACSSWHRFARGDAALRVPARDSQRIAAAVGLFIVSPIPLKLNFGEPPVCSKESEHEGRNRLGQVIEERDAFIDRCSSSP